MSVVILSFCLVCMYILALVAKSEIMEHDVTVSDLLYLWVSAWHMLYIVTVIFDLQKLNVF